MTKRQLIGDHQLLQEEMGVAVQCDCFIRSQDAASKGEVLSENFLRRAGNSLIRFVEKPEIIIWVALVETLSWDQIAKKASRRFNLNMYMIYIIIIITIITIIIIIIYIYILFVY